MLAAARPARPRVTIARIMWLTAIVAVVCAFPWLVVVGLGCGVFYAMAFVLSSILERRVTLIECLVVLSILFVLIAQFAPAVQTRCRGRRAVTAAVAPPPQGSPVAPGGDDPSIDLDDQLGEPAAPAR